MNYFEKMMKKQIAPADPVAKRPFFYLLQEKEIFAGPRSDNRGVQFLYMDNGRLIDSAKIAGNVKDEAMLELLKTTQGLRKMVHSIGVSVSAKERDRKVDFIFQMYGKTDVYHSGTVISHTMRCDGIEQVYFLDEENWSEDDKEPGQIRFEFDTPEVLATVNIKLYLKDGFDAPEVIEDSDIDYDSEAYKNMIAGSLLSKGNAVAVKKVIDKARNGENVTFAYIGGSITQGAGAVPIHTNCYAYQSYKAFADKYGSGDNVRFIKAGIGGTSSELGMIRFERDVLNYGTSVPDLVVVEFAVNDEGDETNGVCYESLVRKILKLPQPPVVLLLFMVFSYDWNLQDRLSPVGYHYDLPMVSIKDAVTEQFLFSKEEGRILSKNQFFYDVFHPGNIGHRITAECIMHLFEEIDSEDVNSKDIHIMDNKVQLPQDAIIGADFEDVHLLDRQDNAINAVIDCGDFNGRDSELQSVERDKDVMQTPQFPENWLHTTGDRPFVMKIKCKSLLIIFKDSAACDVGKACLYVDGSLIATLDPHEVGWVHCNAKIMLDDRESHEHEIVVRMAEGCESMLFTILGFGYVV